MNGEKILKSIPKPCGPKSSGPEKGSALLIILAFVTLITVLVVSLLLTARFERNASSLALGAMQSQVLADYAADLAMGRLREAIDDGRKFGSSSYTTWASEPGRIHVFTISQSDGSIVRSARDLFSALPGSDAAFANVDLNKASLAGKHAITGTVPGTMKVGWVNVTADPTQAASQTNPAVGRVAYWVDDESCKVNVNTADGSKKVLYNSTGTVKSGDIAKSFGFGTPSEISLLAFGLSNIAAGNIASYAATFGLNSASEISRIPDVPAGFYEANKFDLTHTSRTPEVNMFGEPRMYLFPVQQISNIPQNIMVGGYGNYGDSLARSINTSVLRAITGPIDFIYPISSMAPTLTATSNSRNQLPTVSATFTRTVALPLPQSPMAFSENRSQSTGVNSPVTNYPLGIRLARYLQGYNSQYQSVRWPAFSGSNVNGFVGKYTIRQINNIALQVLDITAGRNAMIDQMNFVSNPTFMVRGYLPDPNSDPTAPSNSDPPSIAYGLGRSPRLNELRIIADTVAPSDLFGNGVLVPSITLKIMLETYFPKYYAGVPLDYGFTFISDFQFGTPGGNTTPKSLNEADLPLWTGEFVGSASAIPPYSDGFPATDIETNPPSALNTRWMEELLQIQDQSNNFAGVDLVGFPSTKAGGDASKDPDQVMAQNYHDPAWVILPPDPAASIDPSAPKVYRGSNNLDLIRRPLLTVQGPASDNNTWSPGSYHASPNLNRNYARFAKTGVTTFNVKGGLAIWTRTGSGTGNFWDMAPLDGIRGQFTGENVSGMVPSSLKPFIKKAVIPVDFSVGVAGSPGASGPTTYVLQVADPLVNKFPRDWVPSTNPDPAQITLMDPNIGNSRTRVYRRGGGDEPDFPRSSNPQAVAANNPTPQGHNLPVDFNGDNPGFRPGGGGDPLSIWLPRQDIRYPKQSRFPSIGALNFVRTGIIPDDTTVDISLQHGTPWRSLSFAPANSQGQTTLKGSYPDWALLDLFTVPFLPQEPYRVDGGGTAIGAIPPVRKLTSGGSTEGRLNINNPASPYPFSEMVAGVTQSPPQRLLPLQALFYGITPTNSYNSTDEPVYSDLDAVTLAANIQSYLQANGPFMIPGQLANVPAISNYTYSGVAANAQSRNDLMKNVVGATTTQSNTFSIWVVSQTFKKLPKNTNYSQFEAGDVITGEVRKRYLVERFIETGKDNLPGNSVNPGLDLILGTADDPLDSNFHPVMTYPLPYRWRIIFAENIIL